MSQTASISAASLGPGLFKGWPEIEDVRGSPRWKQFLPNLGGPPKII